MRKRNLIIVSLWILAALCWGLVLILEHTDRIVFVRTSDLGSTSGVRLMDPNAGMFEILGHEPNRVNIKWSDTSIHIKGNARKRMRENSQNVQVLGELSNGRSYPVVIDTGFYNCMAVTDTVVTDAGLAIYPMANSGHDLIGGLCELPSLKIGNVTVERPPCEYWLAHYERCVLGVTKWREMKINLGLGLLRKFSYMRIDNVDREVEFGGKEPFDPGEKSQWDNYPMVVEFNEKGRAKLLVDMPMADQTRRIRFDTGAASGLVLTDKIWAGVSPSLQLIHEEEQRLATPLAGWLPCRRITVELLTLGKHTISAAQIDVTANDNLYGQDNFTLGMGYFRETVIVLDFEKELLWIRNPT